MNCDECKEKVLDLIERESLDPEGVRATLANCPECRAKFDELKAMLDVAQQLPLEAPPERLDVLILQAAEARTRGGGATASARTSPWRQQLAMAAIALLVVGIGVSTVSIVRDARREQLADAPAADEAPAPAEDLEEALAGGEPERIELAEAIADQPTAPANASEKLGAAREVRATRARAPKKKEAAFAEPKQAADQLADEDDVAGVANKEDASAEAQRKCARRTSRFEKRTERGDEYEPSAEELLDVGLCYQLLGKRGAARYWLKRAAEDPSTKARAEDALEKLR